MGHPAALSWSRARVIARSAAPALAAVDTSLPGALGATLADPIRALTDLPAYDASAMDGWALCGSGPWRVVGESRPGQVPPPVSAGEAVSITTGSVLPEGSDTVLRSEDAHLELEGRRVLGVDPLTGIPDTTWRPRAWTDVRRRGEECRSGDLLVAAGLTVTPAIIGLAAAAGHDVLRVLHPPTVSILITGDELLDSGLPRPGHVRDALGPMLPAWIAELGGRAHPPLRIADRASSLREALEDADADLIVTTGSTAAGTSDHLRVVLTDLGAHWLVDGVAVRPGHPMMLARLGDGRLVLGLPGNPLAAISGLLTLGAPILEAMRGLPADVEPTRVFLGAEVRPHPDDTRLIPVAIERQPRPTAMPLRFTGPAMLRGLAHADALAVITPDSGRRGDVIEVLGLASR